MRIHHLALRTPDLSRLERFYVDTLGFLVTRRQDGRSVWLDAGGAILMLEEREGGEPAIPDGAKELIAFAIGADEHAHYEGRLARAGVAIEDRTPSTLYFRDPDGRRVGLSAWPAALAVP
jgi:catechol 2,3-dioxygenase-like lactoylglutathione lyase family enzyme